ncbi:hypothetical protein COCON_G00041210 [Conger conger]|uniref:Ig-like domain-containing protein n=1 Tax=Conger conger TaxID=82655 RepID=A0A9Q1DTN2_CONCO|nr:hypothetical protein COCON_G00041210 [Conger conger]
MPVTTLTFNKNTLCQKLAFNENRTLSLDKLEETDAGPYLLEQFDTAGIAHKTEITIILTCLKGFHEVHGDLGGSVAVFGRNLTGLSMISEARWEKNGLVVAQLNQSRPVYSEKPEGRLRMLPTGECWLDRVHSEDAGNYTLEVSKGDLRLRWTAQLVFRVPRPSVEHRCLLDGTAEFHCLVNPGVRTRWILHGNPLGLGVPENKKMVLHFFSGELLCVLEEYPERRVSVSFTCAAPEVPSTTYILAVFCSLGIVLILSLVGFYIHQQRQRPGQSQSPQLVTMEVQIYELTDTDEFQPRPPSMLGNQDDFYSCITDPLEMSTFTT